jgi:zinc/manganese transport system substrate-binding protein
MLFIAAVLMTVLAASTLSASAADRPVVVATFSVIGDMVANVGGDHVSLVTIVGPGGDCELYKPTLADGRAVAGASIVFINDLNDEFEPWIEPLLKQAGFRGTKVVVSRGAHTITSEDEHPIGGRSAVAIDQHAWLDPKNGAIYVRNIADALVRTDPGNAADYRSRAAGYIKELQDVDAWARTEMSAVAPAQRRVILSHDSLQYLARAFGITLISIRGWTNKVDPAATEVSQLTRQIEQEHLRALFLDSITDPRLTQRIAQETGAIIGGTLYGDALSAPGSEADTYLKMIRHDIATLKAGMLKN